MENLPPFPACTKQKGEMPQAPLENIFDQMGLDEIAAAAETAKAEQEEAELLAASEAAAESGDDHDAMRVSGEGGSSGRSTTMFQSDGEEAEWSATGMIGVSLAEQGRGSKVRVILTQSSLNPHLILT